MMKALARLCGCVDSPEPSHMRYVTKPLSWSCMNCRQNDNKVGLNIDFAINFQNVSKNHQY